MHIKLSQHWFTFPAFFFFFKPGHCKGDTSVEKKGGSDSSHFSGSCTPKQAFYNSSPGHDRWVLLENIRKCLKSHIYANGMLRLVGQCVRLFNLALATTGTNWVRVKETSHCTSTIYDLTTLFFNFIYFFFGRHSGESRSNRERKGRR